MRDGISMELLLLLAAVAIGLLQLVWAMVAGLGAGRDLGWMLGARDDARPIGGVAARLERAFRNFSETFPLFATALIVALMAGKAGAFTHWGSALYVGARGLYPVVYAAGLPVVRTLVWTVSVAGIVLVAVAAFR
jgi:uncharacterized MAPEG superfamily protein